MARVPIGSGTSATDFFNFPLFATNIETPDQVHGMRIADLICGLPNARELLFVAFDGEAQNVQINAAFGIARLGKRAGPEGRQRLLNGLPGPPTRRRDAMLKALAILDQSPARQA